MTPSFAGDSSYFLDLLSRYRRDQDSVPADWRLYFEAMDQEPGGTATALLIEQLVSVYRQFGHLEAALDPLDLTPRGAAPEIGSIREKLAKVVNGTVCLSIAGEALSSDVHGACERLAAVYSANAAIEAGHVADPGQRALLYELFEEELVARADDAIVARGLETVLLADEFEKFIRIKWPTKKRFGIEGAEASAVILKEVLRTVAENGCREVVIGGMHRGRLAMLATVLGKSLLALMSELKGRDLSDGDPSFTGDVPYHNGLASSIETGMGRLDVRLLPHPSHLTVVAAVASGAARARHECSAEAPTPAAARRATLPLMMHTDAAFSGQGLVSELLQLGALDGYGVGGTIHLVVNNQIGFTTLPEEARASRHPTEIGKAYGIPILHVNGDDPVAAAAVARVAARWRMAAGRDVIIDVVCYRRNGHNELDEPRFTQPQTWAAIDRRPTLRTAYSQAVRQRSPAVFETAEARRTAFEAALHDAYLTCDDAGPNDSRGDTDIFPAPGCEPGTTVAGTGLPREALVSLAHTICAIPHGFEPNPKVRQFFEQRLDSIENDSGFNMATAEALGFASLLAEGASVRLSGQDSVRGTFSQRHLRLHDRANGATSVPLAAVAKGNARFDAINSPLSEYAVLAFEYGLSLADPDRLVVWEAQFGDFLNGAQVAVDQFIVTAGAKWRLASSLVVALPHGLEGQGPDHSSARVERMLQSCANDNIVVANPSTPANLFHLYRRQLRGGFRKPLFLIAPKSLLRQRACSSRLADISTGTGFRPVLVDAPSTGRCRRAVLCSGKIFYTLHSALVQAGVTDVALVRVEQLYPFPKADVIEALAGFAGAPLVWCQEEPQNQGGWSFVREMLEDAVPGVAVSYCGRPRMAAAAGGSVDRHEREQAVIVANALGLD